MTYIIAEEPASIQPSAFITSHAKSNRSQKPDALNLPNLCLNKGNRSLKPEAGLALTLKPNQTLRSRDEAKPRLSSNNP